MVRQPVAGSGFDARLHPQQARVASISNATWRTQISVGASPSLAKIEAATERPKNARSSGDTARENRSRYGNGTLEPLARWRYAGFPPGRYSVEAKACVAGLCLPRLDQPLPRKGGYDIVLMWKSSLKSPRILSMEALLHPRSVMELPPKPIRLLICVRWLETLSNATFTTRNKCR